MRSSSLTCWKVALLTILGVIIQTIGISLFVFGFFPVKPTLPGTSGPESFRGFVENESQGDDLLPHQLKSLYQELSGIQPIYDRLIFMVVDGLPAEFVLGKDGKPPAKKFSDAMPYTQSLLANGMAIGYHAKAAPPTVTMPRLKAMVSGAIGGFLDVAFNFNTQALLDDNVLDQLSKIGWKMVMLGDETWIKLFPKLFMRHDGVSSFFVKDTIEVDHNVSRHLGDELDRDDWNLLILHYLGLDHVGHIGGRSSSLMPPKLTEMDEVIQMIHLRTAVPRNEAKTLLVVVSDHGMTENGNHGGSSYEETDSLALFIGLNKCVPDYASATAKTAYQVDIAPTLALLYGVPIPKNSVGVMLSGTLDSLTEEQGLRSLQLNSWQMLRLVQAQLPRLSCGNSSSAEFLQNQINKCGGDMGTMLCCLYMNATALHNSWKFRNTSRSSSRKDLDGAVAAYYEFLGSSSEWLSRRATEKPLTLLAVGVIAMIVSCIMLLSLLYRMCKKVHPGVNQQFSDSTTDICRWCLDDYFVFGVILIVSVSMGSSSLVEEEQYIWHFMTTTLYLLLLRKTLKSMSAGRVKTILCLLKEKNGCSIQLFSVLMLLICGRILRGWHQGGVNWVHLPDISKWLEQAGGCYMKAFQLLSGILVISTTLIVLCSYGKKRKMVLLILGISFLTSGLLVLHHNLKYHDNSVLASSSGATLSAQIIYAAIGITTIGMVLALPWVAPSHNGYLSPSVHLRQSKKSLRTELGDRASLIGVVYLYFWCLLQLLLQQSINSMPIFLLLVQILAVMLYASNNLQDNKILVEVAALFYLGMAGHFALGNTNTLATIDVAGAFIGISNHSTFLSGVLMFIITFASPLLSLLSIVMYMSVKVVNIYSSWKGDSEYFLTMLLGLPCLIPLALNSIILTSYTIIFLLMRNHLFVWSVFSPKYLYVCAMTACIYIGVSLVAATGIYMHLVLTQRNRRQRSVDRDRRMR